MDLLRKLAVLAIGLASAGGALELLCLGGGGRGLPLAALGAVGEGRREAPTPEAAPADPITAESPGGIQTLDPSTSTVPRLSLAPGGPPAGAAVNPGAPPGMRARTVRMRVTAYCRCAICCGHDTGITASGKTVNYNGARFAAASNVHLLSAGAKVSVGGYCGGRSVPVIDRMADEGPPRLDVYFRSHQQAKEWGVKWMDVTVYTPAK